MSLESDIQSLTTAINKLADAFTASAASVATATPATPVPATPAAAVAPVPATPAAAVAPVPATPATPVTPPPATPAGVVIGVTQLREVGMKVIKAGKAKEMKEILTAHGVDAVSKLPENLLAPVHAKLSALVP